VRVIFHISTLICLLALLAARGVGVGRAADRAEVWGGEPYRIHVQLAIDAPGELADQLAAELPDYLHDRVNTSIGIVWRLKTQLATGPLRHQMLRGVDSFAAEDLGDSAPDEDKRLLVSIRATPWGDELTAREFDRYAERWGPTLRRTVRQRDALPEQLFGIVEQAVAPLARYRPDPKNPQQVVLELRGADLPRSGPDFTSAKPGDVFQPMLRRSTRDGALVPGGVAVVSWTYLEVIEPTERAAQPIGRIRSVTQRPLGGRHGRVEQVAIGLRNDPGDLTLELRSRIDREKPLVGYEVSAQDVDEQAIRPLGKSNAAGEATVSPGKSAVQFVYVKSDGVMLARLPVVPGADERVTVPLPDDDVRLRVGARLSALREDVVDLVARRTIFMARVRQEIEAKNFDAARELLESLDELPGQTQFSLALDREARRFRTDDVQVQRRIDRLFTETRTALGKFLDPQAIGALHEEFRRAQELEEETRSEGDKKTS